MVPSFAQLPVTNPWAMLAEAGAAGTIMLMMAVKAIDAAAKILGFLMPPSLPPRADGFDSYARQAISTERRFERQRV